MVADAARLKSALRREVNKMGQGYGADLRVNVLPPGA
jgi:hypothetical protein